MPTTPEASWPGAIFGNSDELLHEPEHAVKLKLNIPTTATFPVCIVAVQVPPAGRELVIAARARGDGLTPSESLYPGALGGLRDEAACVHPWQRSRFVEAQAAVGAAYCTYG